MRRAPTLGIVIVLLLAWLASPPPARACGPPPPKPLFSPVFTFTFPDNTLLVTKAEYEPYGIFLIEFFNKSQSVIYFLGSSDLPISVYEVIDNYKPPDGLTVYFAVEPEQFKELAEMCSPCQKFKAENYGLLWMEKYMQYL